MEHTSFISSIALLLVVAYYATHGWRALRHEWHRVKWQLHAGENRPRRWKLLDLLVLFLLSGCVQAGPVLFYGIHLYELVHLVPAT